MLINASRVAEIIGKSRIWVVRHARELGGKRAGVRWFGFHGIRHLSASVLDNAGLPLRVIQGMLRHKNSTTTSRYLHELEGVDAKLDGVFKRRSA